jgi:hypothetical protein
MRAAAACSSASRWTDLAQELARLLTPSSLVPGPDCESGDASPSSIASDALLSLVLDASTGQGLGALREQASRDDTVAIFLAALEATRLQLLGDVEGALEVAGALSVHTAHLKAVRAAQQP